MDSHSRMVQFFKILLPLVAIVLLSTVFLLSRSIDTDGGLPFTREGVSDQTDDQIVTLPDYRGTTRKGEEVHILATRAVQGSQNAVPTASEFQGRLGLSDGGEITLDSNSGLIRPDKNVATFIGNVVITTTDGIEVTTDMLNTSLDEIRGDTPGRVNGTGIIGNFSAGRMTFGTEKTDGPVHIIFTDGVKLVYEPEKAER